MRTRITVSALLVVFLAATLASADWATWRGPNQSGAQTDGTSIIDSLEGTTPELLWASDAIPGDEEGGFASPAVVDGKAYLFCSWRTWFPIEHRILAKGAANNLGGVLPEDMPAELSAQVDTARQSEERAALKQRNDIEKWVKDWLNGNLTEEQQKDRALRGFVERRLRDGERALSMDVIGALQPIIDKRFDNQAELDAWYAGSGIDKETWDRRIKNAIPVKESTIEDVSLCLDATTGKIVWKKAYESKAGQWGSSSTPCVVGNKVFVAGANGAAYCFDAATGEEMWQTQLANPGGGAEINSSFVHADGKVFILMNRLVALDAATGEIAWEQKELGAKDASPIVWKQGGQTRLLCAARDHVYCVSASDGSVIWKAGVGASSVTTPVMAGSSIAVPHTKGMSLFRISASSAEQIVALEEGGSRGCSAATDGKKVYAYGKGAFVCVDAATGEILWSNKNIREDFASPTIADGKVLCFTGKGELAMLDAESGEEKGKAKVDFLRCVSPILDNGLLYVRTKTDMRCYDLRK